MKKVSYAGRYKVGQGDVRLEVLIGEGQFGSSLVTLGPKVFLQSHDFGDVVGKGAELAGKTLKVFSVVTDVNEQTNRTSVTYRLTGGPAPLEQTLSFTVEQERNSVDYDAEIALEA